MNNSQHYCFYNANGELLCTPDKAVKNHSHNLCYKEGYGNLLCDRKRNHIAYGNPDGYYNQIYLAKKIRKETENNRFRKMYNHNKRIGVYGLYQLNRMNDYTGFGINGLEGQFRQHQVVRMN